MAPNTPNRYFGVKQSPRSDSPRARSRRNRKYVRVRRLFEERNRDVRRPTTVAAAAAAGRRPRTPPPSPAAGQIREPLNAEHRPPRQQPVPPQQAQRQQDPQPQVPPQQQHQQPQQHQPPQQQPQQPQQHQPPQQQPQQPQQGPQPEIHQELFLRNLLCNCDGCRWIDMSRVALHQGALALAMLPERGPEVTGELRAAALWAAHRMMEEGGQAILDAILF